MVCSKHTAISNRHLREIRISPAGFLALGDLGPTALESVFKVDGHSCDHVDCNKLDEMR